MSVAESMPSVEAPVAPSNGLAGVRPRAQSPTVTDGIRLTPKAVQMVRQYMGDEASADSKYLYVGVKGGGCSGLQPMLDLRDVHHTPIAETDEVFDTDGLLVVCDLKSYIVGKLSGTEIDYQESLMGAGFVFNNPNAKHSCGCGSSYSA